MARTKWDWELVAKRFKERRKLFDWSIDEVAARSGVSRDTVMRVEKGKPCSDKSLHALRGVYALFSAQLVRHEPESPHFSACHADQVRWMAATHRDHKGRLVKDIDYSFVDDPVERRRRATLGYQRFFTGFIRSELEGGVMNSGLMEIYQPSWTDQHYGEEYVYCLSGEAVMTVESEQCHLKPGDSMVFDATKKHSYAPAEGSELP
ncbi:MAG: XRE family transcriptional regulator, partial [Armatimonadota bacterium]